MRDNHTESNEGGFHFNADGFNCLPCKCRKTFHKETKINSEGKTIIEDRTSEAEELPRDENEIFRSNTEDNEGVDTMSTGWGSRKPTP